jgi:ZIP family zinc transporter
VPVSWIPRQHPLIYSILLTGGQQIPLTTVCGTALLVGTTLDGIPENDAIDVSLVANGRGLVLVLLEVLFPSKLPASMSSEVGMDQVGRTGTYIILA